ncbi:hypothetical protein B484DRAFT_390938 [Ochromonadaceae sp. CCMP2298]|nr:hypothetical protein B484DRAFT_390938 [Ochromonadaceae sp. CCMP2298]
MRIPGILLLALVLSLSALSETLDGGLVQLPSEKEIQVLDANEWRTADVPIKDDFVQIIDGDYSSFYIKRLVPTSVDWVSDCYEVRLTLDKPPKRPGVFLRLWNWLWGIKRPPPVNGMYRFCYPSLHVAGMGKCGTSAIFQFFGDHTQYIAAKLGTD